MKVHEVRGKAENQSCSFDGSDDSAAEVADRASAEDPLKFVRVVKVVTDEVEEVNYEVGGIRFVTGVPCQAAHGCVTTLGVFTVVR